MHTRIRHAIGFFLLILITIPAGAADTDTSRQPRAHVKQREMVFEPTPEGIELHHAFIIENIGTAPLQILNVKTG